MSMHNYSSVDEIVSDLKENPIEASGNVYHPIPFPEFDHLTTSSVQDAVHNKWELIRGLLSRYFGDRGDLSGKRILDVGANGGFYTFNLAKMGAHVTAFEPIQRYSTIGQFLAKEKHLPVDWHLGPYDSGVVGDEQFDLALMLSVFQWMADGGSRMEYAVDSLRKISEQSQALIFELGFNRGKSAIRTSKLNHYAALIDLLKSGTRFQNYFLLGKTALWKNSVRYLVFCSNDDRYEDHTLRKITRSLHL